MLAVRDIDFSDTAVVFSGLSLTVKGGYMPRSALEHVRGTLLSLGWEKSDSHLLVAVKPVDTFRGVVYAGVENPATFDNGTQSFSAVFISEERNALARCHLYVSAKDGPDAIAAKVREFDGAIGRDLAGAYSVRVAKPRTETPPSPQSAEPSFSPSR